MNNPFIIAPIVGLIYLLAMAHLLHDDLNQCGVKYSTATCVELLR
jgi:hypothetical protein